MFVCSWSGVLVFVANALALAGCGCFHASEQVGGRCPSRRLHMSVLVAV